MLPHLSLSPFRRFISLYVPNHQSLFILLVLLDELLFVLGIFNIDHNDFFKLQIKLKSFLDIEILKIIIGISDQSYFICLILFFVISIRIYLRLDDNVLFADLFLSFQPFEKLLFIETLVVIFFYLLVFWFILLLWFLKIV